jgi:hypothetical protein
LQLLLNFFGSRWSSIVQYVRFIKLQILQVATRTYSLLRLSCSSCVFWFVMCRWWWIPATAELIILSCMSPYLWWIPSEVPRDAKLNHLRRFSICEFSLLARFYMTALNLCLDFRIF